MVLEAVHMAVKVVGTACRRMNKSTTGTQETAPLLIWKKGLSYVFPILMAVSFLTFFSSTFLFFLSFFILPPLLKFLLVFAQKVHFFQTLTYVITIHSHDQNNPKTKQ